MLPLTTFLDYTIDSIDLDQELDADYQLTLRCIYDFASVFVVLRRSANTSKDIFTIFDSSCSERMVDSNQSASDDIQIYTHDAVEWAGSGGVVSKRNALARIGNNCCICPNEVIAAGKIVAEGALIGADGFVLEEGKFARNPARLLVSMEQTTALGACL